jgi:hypothetical protein
MESGTSKLARNSAGIDIDLTFYTLFPYKNKLKNVNFDLPA